MDGRSIVSVPDVAFSKGERAAWPDVRFAARSRANSIEAYRLRALVEPDHILCGGEVAAASSGVGGVNGVASTHKSFRRECCWIW